MTSYVRKSWLGNAGEKNATIGTPTNDLCYKTFDPYHPMTQVRVILLNYTLNLHRRGCRFLLVSGTFDSFTEFQPYNRAMPDSRSGTHGCKEPVVTLLEQPVFSIFLSVT